MIVIVGPCVIESEGFILEVAQELKRQLTSLPIDFYFKASFDKANRSSIDGFRGPGLEKGLKILSRVKELYNLSLLTDFHSIDQALPVAKVVDYLQVPAFLCRQTDLIFAGAQAAHHYHRKLNLKKGQFLSPWETQNMIEKARHRLPQTLQPDWLSVTERGSCFGYQRLIVDMIAFQTIQTYQVPVIYDATHSVQQPGAGPHGKTSGGQRHYIESLARAAIAAGADGIFLECHPHPEQAKSDAATSIPLERVGPFLQQLLTLQQTISHLPKVLS